jgi:hypothetical protein
LLVDFVRSCFFGCCWNTWHPSPLTRSPSSSVAVGANHLNQQRLKLTQDFTERRILPLCQGMRQADPHFDGGVRWKKKRCWALHSQGMRFGQFVEHSEPRHPPNQDINIRTQLHHQSNSSRSILLTHSNSFQT